MKAAIIFLLCTILFSFDSIICNACTIFVGISKHQVLVGNNEDFIDPNTFFWTLKGEKNKLGRIYFGFVEGLPQGGMNEKGLFFDCAGVPPRIGKYYKNKGVYEGSLMEKAMETCSNVEEVARLFDQYDRSYMTYQILFADKEGNSIIVETDTIIFKKGKYQLVTNFCHSNKTPGSYSIERYNLADSLLKKENQYSVEYFREILRCSHQDTGSPTQYSNIYDLKSGDICLYLFHNYSNSIRLNIFNELKKGNTCKRLSDLAEGSEDYKSYLSRFHMPVYQFIPSVNIDFSRLAGEYIMDGFPPVSYYITQEKGNLFLRMSGFNKYKLQCISKTTFYMKELNLVLTFNQIGNLPVNKISVSIYGLLNYTATRIQI